MTPKLHHSIIEPPPVPVPRRVGTGGFEKGNSCSLVESDEPAGCNLIGSVDRFLNPDNRVASRNFTVRAKREVFEAVVDLLPGETVELNPLGLPIPRPTTIKMPRNRGLR